MTKEAEAYISEARHKLSVSRELIGLDEHEDSVSRSYYAMYFAARAALASEGSYPKTHSGVASEFGRLFVSTKRLPVKLVKDLEKTRSYREELDYTPGSKVPKETAEKVLKSAEKFVDAIAGCLASKPGAGEDGKGALLDGATWGLW